MENFKVFSRVYMAVEALYRRPYTQLDIERAFKRYLKVKGL